MDEITMMVDLGVSVGAADKSLQGEDYVVLSHCWGRPTEEEKKRFCTTRQNYQDRLQGFSYDELPRTFQDAVRVTQLLEKQYLWIDALCIIQGPDGDWNSEARTMEDIFANAYCTIAASSARGWEDGFLKSEFGYSGTGMPGIPTILNCACDFEKDVDEGPLVKRAWVLQERVLSRRIIHFTARHTYWECGEGVRCERFTKLKPPLGKQYFILDPNFPDRLSQSGYQRTLDFVQLLFKKYSTSGLTFESDRDVAIYSLVERMRKFLLWKRSGGEKTARIDYGDRSVPSWSWMAYPGAIDFILDAKQRIMVPRSEDLDFADDGDTLIVKVRRFTDCRIGQDEKRFAIFARTIFAWTRKVGSLWFDVADRIELKYCVVIGMGDDIGKTDPRKTYYFILVREKQGERGYERVGVGKVEAQLEMRRISTSAPIRISIFLPRISPLEMRRVSSTKARANHVDDAL
ncbi:heterokaryon incompatibility [Fusarium beomiforme]|uniref:Heterokaryon incompatibility n=1 Tax=Fusarium beomiforme TaxID=44412 RepID=A0A9P5DQ32_9HYPO|nr:heterokaryon incompatibility [Fusarium beomiforme]